MHTMAALIVASCTVGAAKVVPSTVPAAVKATKAMNMVKKMAAPSNCKSAAADEAGASDEARHQARHLSHLYPLLFFLFRRSPEFARQSVWITCKS
jgi:hypothetical protein